MRWNQVCISPNANWPAGATKYYPGVGGRSGTISTTSKDEVAVPVSYAVTLDVPRANCSGSTTGSILYTLYYYRSGSWTTTGISVNVTGSGDFNGTGSFDAQAGDLLAWEGVETGTVTARRICVSLRCTTSGNKRLYWGTFNTATLGATATTYGRVMGGGVNGTETSVYSQIPTGGDFSDLYVCTDAAVTAGTLTVTARLNTADNTTLQVSITSGRTKSDTTGSIACVRNDYWAWKIETYGLTPSTIRVGWCALWTPTTAGEGFLSSNVNGFAASATEYAHPWDGADSSTTEGSGSALHVASYGELKSFLFTSASAPGSSQTWTIAGRRLAAAAGAPSNVSVVLDNTNYQNQGDTTNSIYYMQRDDISFGVTGTASVTGSRVLLACVDYTPEENISNGCVHYFKLDNDLTDEIGSTDLSTDGSPTFSTTYKLGTHSLDCSGSSQRARLADANFTAPTTAMTIVAWVRPKDSTTGDHPILSKGNSTDESWALIRIGNTNLRWYISDSSDVSQLLVSHGSMGGNIVVDEWFLFVATYDAGAGRVFFFRPSSNYFTFLGGTGGPSSLNDSAEPFYINWASNDYVGTPGVYGDAMYDGVGVWNRVLTFAEIAELYNDGSGDESWLPAGGATNPKGVFGLPMFGPMRRVVFP